MIATRETTRGAGQLLPLIGRDPITMTDGVSFAACVAWAAIESRLLRARIISCSEDSIRYPGWKVVAAAFVGVMVGFAGMVPFTFSLFLDPLHASFGWNREAISRAFGIAALTVAVVSPLLGHLLDRLPPRRVILPSIVIFSAAMASLSLLHQSLPQYYATYLVLGVVGNGTAQLAYSRAVLSWFGPRRGLSIALMLTGSGTGSIVLPLFTQHVLAAHGWRAAYLALGAVGLVGFPLTAAFVRNRSVPHRGETPTFARAAPRQASGWSFALIALPTLFVALSINALVAHLSPLLTSRGVAATSAAVALSVWSHRDWRAFGYQLPARPCFSADDCVRCAGHRRSGRLAGSAREHTCGWLGRGLADGRGLRQRS